MANNKRKNKQYIPRAKFNPVVQGQKIEILGEQIRELKDATRGVIQNYDRHIEYLANFVKHDIKNGIHSIDGIIYNSNIPNKEKEALQTAVSVLRVSLENFSKITQGSSNEPFLARDLFSAISMLVRNELNTKNIELCINYDRDDETPIHQSIHSFMQILHNFIINSVNALSLIDHESKKIKITFSHNSSDGLLEIFDSGVCVTDIGKIWDHSYSTTGGTGIGLSHINYLVKEMRGTRDCVVLDSDLYTKKFVVTFPLNSHCDENE